MKYSYRETVIHQWKENNLFNIFVNMAIFIFRDMNYESRTDQQRFSNQLSGGYHNDGRHYTNLEASVLGHEVLIFIVKDNDSKMVRTLLHLIK